MGLYWMIIGCLLLVACTTQAPAVANPASRCNGYAHSIVTNPGGSQTGYCTLPNGTVCEEWQLFRGECP